MKNCCRNILTDPPILGCFTAIYDVLGPFPTTRVGFENFGYPPRSSAVYSRDFDPKNWKFRELGEKFLSRYIDRPPHSGVFYSGIRGFGAVTDHQDPILLPPCPGGAKLISRDPDPKK